MHLNDARASRVKLYQQKGIGGRPTSRHPLTDTDAETLERLSVDNLSDRLFKTGEHRPAMALGMKLETIVCEPHLVGRLPG